jgi:cytidylate kinase
MAENLVIALDGPAGAGKSTIARKLAEVLGIGYLDTGALYRAIALYLAQKGISANDDSRLPGVLKEISISLAGGNVCLNGIDVSDKIRSPRIDSIVSSYAELGTVRNRLLDLQRDQAKQTSLVADGRDMGTVVFPEAQIKIFLSASPETRARRRWLEQTARGEEITLEEVLRQVLKRDYIDSHRDIAPLIKAPEATEVDSSNMIIEEVVETILNIIKGQDLTFCSPHAKEGTDK